MVSIKIVHNLYKKLWEFLKAEMVSDIIPLDDMAGMKQTIPIWNTKSSRVNPNWDDLESNKDALDFFRGFD